MCQIWRQNQSNIVEVIERIKNKALGILNFKGPQELVDYLYKKSKNLKNNLPETFSNFFTLKIQLHKHNTRIKRFILPKAKTTS